MLKLMSYLSKREGMTTEEFIDYYENHHVPLILSLTPPPPVYRRHYLQRGDGVNIGEGAIDFDVVTEQAWTDRESFHAWMAAVTTGSAGERVNADEARFLDRPRTRCTVVTDHTTPSSPSR